MSYKLTVEPEAEAEIDEASRWYADRDEKLGMEFLAAIDAAFKVILENPFQYQILHGKKRRVPLTRFPYRLIYIVRSKEVAVVGCLHGQRNPTYWEERGE